MQLLLETYTKSNVFLIIKKESSAEYGKNPRVVLGPSGLISVRPLQSACTGAMKPQNLGWIGRSLTILSHIVIHAVPSSMLLPAVATASSTLQAQAFASPYPEPLHLLPFLYLPSSLSQFLGS